jgi:hypothetical protein
VRPEPGTLSWAEGQVPTPHGTIDVQWGRDHGGFQLHVCGPRGTRGEVAVPVSGADPVVSVNGHVVWQGSRFVAANAANVGGAVRAGGYLRLTGVSGGSVTVTVTS